MEDDDDWLFSSSPLCLPLRPHSPPLITRQREKNVVFQIEVHGTSPCMEYNNLKQLYPYIFRICRRKTKRYELMVSVSTLYLSCGVFETQSKAQKALNQYMKTAMKGYFLYQNCPNCSHIEYFPAEKCRKCHIEMWGYWEMNKNEISPEQVRNVRRDAKKTQRERC